jgi:hypothetical protein
LARELSSQHLAPPLSQRWSAEPTKSRAQSTFFRNL